MSQQDIYYSNEYNVIKIEPTNECACCMDEIVSELDATELICFHRFHTNCLLIWFNEKSTCPVCRRDVGEMALQYHKHIRKSQFIHRKTTNKTGRRHKINHRIIAEKNN